MIDFAWLAWPFGLIGLVIALSIYFYIAKQSPGNEVMRDIAEQIELGSMAFLRREYTVLTVFVALVAALLLFALPGIWTAIAFLFGAASSMTAGFIGMKAATKANVRTSEAARSSGQGLALRMAFSGGAVMGLAVASLGLFGVGLMYYLGIHRPGAFMDTEIVSFAAVISGYAMGASTIALFARVGGGNDKSLAGLGDYPTAGVHHLQLHRLPDSTPPIEDLLCRLPTNELVFGHESDGDYVKWQVVKQPERFERAGRPHDHLPKYWNENVRAERIDISQNPGRWEIRNGKYIEAVGSPMWIGPLFAERTGGDWRGMKEYDWCEITELDNGVVRLTSWDGPFDSDQGEQRERQEVLRKVLFPQPDDK